MMLSCWVQLLFLPLFNEHVRAFYLTFLSSFNEIDEVDAFGFLGLVEIYFGLNILVEVGRDRDLAALRQLHEIDKVVFFFIILVLFV